MNAKQLRAEAVTSPQMGTEQTPEAKQTPQPMHGAKRLAPGGLRTRFPVRWAQALRDVLPDWVWRLLQVLVILLLVF